MTSEVAGQTRPGHDGLFKAVSYMLRTARGFVVHSLHPINEGWRVIKIQWPR